MGDMLAEVVTELKSFDAQEQEKGFFEFQKKYRQAVQHEGEIQQGGIQCEPDL